MTPKFNLFSQTMSLTKNGDDKSKQNNETLMVHPPQNINSLREFELNERAAMIGTVQSKHDERGNSLGKVNLDASDRMFSSRDGMQASHESIKMERFTKINHFAEDVLTD